MGKTSYQKKYRENMTDEQKQKQKQKDYQKEYIKNMTDEQKKNIEKLKNINIIT